MQDLIKTHLGADLTARVEKKAAARGITDLWEIAIDRAKLELGESAPEADIVARAAIRASQRVGVLPRLAKTDAGGAELPTPPSENAGGSEVLQTLPVEPEPRGRKKKPTDA